ncbi:hypothetical protein [Halostella litorea]|uniref:hypothetical protein n=1 Tax=Halostella litorea TaxID=2528831 RepID=UPI001092ACA5|nr:hypothetical protein [Halostella litorea]
MSDAQQETLTDTEQDEWRELMNKPPENLTDAEKTSKIKLSIKRRFDPPEWSLAFELASPNGRRADAIAVNTFPSRNFKVVGFEFKASRSDWLSEKNEGAKADYFVTACDEWYVVAWSGVVEESELPEGWGLFELKPNSEQIWKQVDSELTEHQQGEPDKAFWGRFIQKTVGGESNYTKQDLREARRRGYEEAEEELTDRRLDREAEDLHDKAETVDKLRDAGLLGYVHPISDDRIERLNKAKQFVQALEGGQFNSLDNELEHFEDNVERRFQDISQKVTEMQDLLDELQTIEPNAQQNEGDA